MSVTSVKGKKTKKPEHASVIFLADKVKDKMKANGPTSLLQFGLNNMLDIQLASVASAYKSYEIVLCLGYETEKVIRYIKSKYNGHKIRVVENKDYENSNYCESLRLSLNNVDSDCVVVCAGDVMTYPELVKASSFDSFIVTQGEAKDNFEVGSVVDESGTITNMSYGLPNSWTEVFCINGYPEIELLRTIVSNPAYKNKFLFEALNEFKENVNLKQVENKFQTVKIDNNKTYQSVRGLYENFNSQLFIRNFD